MNALRITAAVLFAVFIMAYLVIGLAQAQAPAHAPELADQLDTLYDSGTTPANQQKFFSILIMLVLGGGATYMVFRGVRKIVAAE